MEALLRPIVVINILFVIVISSGVSIVSSGCTNGFISVSINVLSVEEENVLVTQTVLFTNCSSGEIRIPLISSTNGLNYSIISVTDDQGGRYDGDIVNGNLVLNISGSRQLGLTIRYTVSGLIEEITPLIYTLLLDTSVFENTNHYVSINIPKHYSVTPLLPSDLKVMGSDNWYIIETNKPDTYVVLIEIPAGYSTPKTTGVSVGVSISKSWAIVGLTILILVVTVVSLYFLKFRSKGIEVETVPPDVMSDDTSKAIVKYIGDKGGEVKQSELASVINRPKSIISRRVKRLAEEGYLEVIPKGKYNILKLTDKGWRAHRELKRGG